MPQLETFRGVRFGGPTATGAVAPPYDVIDPPLHRRLLDHHPSPVVRLTLGDDPERPMGDEAEYRERGRLLARWLEEGVLARDEQPALYHYELEFTAPGGARQRYEGLFGAVPALPWGEGGVLPHEEIRPKVVDDRFLLMRCTASQLGIVQLVVDGRDGVWGRCLAEAPRELLMGGEDATAHRHRLAAIRDPHAVRSLSTWMASQVAVVADGHHRYTTAARIHRETQLAGRERVVVVIGDLFQDGITIHPTHRLLCWDGPDNGRTAEARDLLCARLDDGGDAPDAWQLEAPGLGASRTLRSRTDRGVSTLARRLQAALDELPVKPVVETYHDRAAAQERLVRSRPGSVLACWMPPVGKAEFWERASHGEIFPPKTTYFLPKIHTGLVARVLDGND